MAVTDPLYELSRELRTAARDAGDEAEKVVKRGALNVKNEWRDNAKRSAGRHGRRYPYSISYDTERAGGSTVAEIGPDHAKSQGPLGAILEFGSVNSPPHNDGGRALRAEEPRFVEALRDVLWRPR